MFAATAKATKKTTETVGSTATGSWDVEEIERARQIVSQAEIEALEYAERLTAEADAMMQAVVARQAELDQAATRAARAAGTTYVKECAEWARVEEARIIDDARRRATELLTNALDVIESHSEEAAADRQQAQAHHAAALQMRSEAELYFNLATQTLDQAERYIGEAQTRAEQLILDARAQCETMLAEARVLAGIEAEAAAKLEAERAERRLVAKLDTLCRSLGMAPGGLDDLLTEVGLPMAEPAMYVDLRTPVAVG